MTEDLQKVADQLKHFPGKVRGEAFRTRLAYIKRKEGDGGVKRLEEKMKELGMPMDFEKIDRNEWVSEGMNSLSVVVAKDIFEWTEDDVFELGRFSLKNSFITKIVFSYFVSIERGFSIIPKYWRRYYDFGELVGKEVNLRDRYAVVQKRGFKTHSLLCIQHRGYLAGAAELLTSSKNVVVEESRCMHRGDEYHEYIIRW